MKQGNGEKNLKEVELPVVQCGKRFRFSFGGDFSKLRQRDKMNFCIFEDVSNSNYGACLNVLVC